MVAAGYSGMRPVMSRLISADADVNALTTNGWSALRDAVKSGDTAKVRLLLDHGAVLLASPRNSNRMMMLSVTQNDTAMLALLLDRGLPVDHGQAGYTGLMAAAADGLEGSAAPAAQPWRGPEQGRSAWRSDVADVRGARRSRT